MILLEAGFLGVAANLLGLALGFALSLVLIYVINKQSFGWTIQFHPPLGAAGRRVGAGAGGHGCSRHLSRARGGAAQSHRSDS